LREECRLRVFENRVLRRIFGLKKEEVRKELRRLHKNELYALYSSPDVIRVFKEIETNRACGTCGGKKRCIQGFSG
jgi:hypothetical protein